MFCSNGSLVQCAGRGFRCQGPQGDEYGNNQKVSFESHSDDERALCVDNGFVSSSDWQAGCEEASMILPVYIEDVRDVLHVHFVEIVRIGIWKRAKFPGTFHRLMTQVTVNFINQSSPNATLVLFSPRSLCTKKFERSIDESRV